MNYLNILNIAAFVANVIITYGSNYSWFGPNNSDLSDKYQLLITPAGVAFSIWGIIFVWEAVFTVVQALPKFSNSAAVQQGVKFWFIAACISQCAWTPLFAQEVMWAQLIAMLAILFSLSGLVYSFASVTQTTKSYDYWLFCAPFSLHLGWIVAASLLSFNVTVLKYCAGSAEAIGSHPACVSSMLTSAIMSLAVILLVAFLAGTCYHPLRNPFIPGVAAWALGWISNELQEPRESILSNFSESYSAVGKSALILSFACLAICLYSLATKVREFYANPTTKGSVDTDRMLLPSQTTIVA